MTDPSTHLEKFDALFSGPAKDIFATLLPLVQLAMMLQFILLLAGDNGIRAVSKYIPIMVMSLFFMSNFPQAVKAFQHAISDQIVRKIKADPGSAHDQFAKALAEAEKNTPRASRFSKENIQNAFTSAFMFIFGMLAQGLQIVMVYFQRILSIGAYALAPLWFALFAIDGQRGGAVRIALHVLALSLWPVSWAVGSLGSQFLIALLPAANSSLAHAIPHMGSTLPILFVIGLYNMAVIIFGPILLHILLPSGGHYALHAAQMGVSKLASAAANIAPKR